jgi:hypothetical protein
MTFPAGYFPTGYFPEGYWPEAASSGFSVGSSGREVDIRLYTSAGLRMYLPSFWIDTLDFEIAERGGYGNGRLSILAGWEDLTLTGTEYVDVRLFGQFAYRGFVLQPEKSVDVPERWNLNLFGLMERLNGFLVRRCQCYAGPVDVSVVFADLITTYVKRVNRLPDVVIDAAGVEALGITVENFCAEGVNVSQAMNDLCDLAPDRLIWGCDVDANGTDRIYLRPKPTTTAAKYFIGDNVRAFIYPRDATQVVNRVYLTGAEADPKNLVMNGSFEECAKPGEQEGNLLENASFEDNGGGSDIDQWDVGYNPTIDSTYKRTGTYSVYMDNNPSGPEEIEQTVPIGVLNGLSMSVWLFVNAGGNNQVRLEMRILDSSMVVLAGLQSFAITPPDDDTWHRYSLDWPDVVSADYPTAAYAQFRITLLACADDTAGVHVDDAALWIPTITAKGWQVGASSTAVYRILDWNHTGSPDPAHGSVKVKIQADITGAGYVEIVQADDERDTVQGGRSYWVTFTVQPSGASGDVQIGVYEYDSGTLVATQVGSTETLVNGLWQQVSYRFTTDPATREVAPFIRFKTDERIYYLDAAGLWETTLPSRYYPGDHFEAEITTDDFDASEIGADAAASITTWGEREAEENADSVRDELSLQAWAKAFFRKWAVPQVEGRLEIFQPDALLTQAGLVEIENLPDAPGALFPSRIRTTVREVIEVSADLNSERPELANILRQVQRETLRRR